MAAVDAHVTVGFVVKDSVSPYLPPAKAATAAGRATGALPQVRSEPAAGGRREEGAAKGLLRLSSFVALPPTEQELPCGGEIDVAEHAHLTSGVKRLIKSVKQGLKACQEPEAATEGLGGTYFFMNDAGRKIAIFKPCDEEPLAPNNPKGFVGRRLGDPGLKPTVRVGEAATREVAAYLLDHDHFARVPHTVMVTMCHPAFHYATGCGSRDGEEQPPTKLGSLQEFVPHEGDTSEMGSSRFAARDVHRIGILDIRLMNTDRHAGNMLVRRPRIKDSSNAPLQSQYELLPIDHGFALPEGFEPPYFEWQHWPQAMMPFGREELEYIARLDAKADVALLRRELPSLREESLRCLEVATAVLKKCAAAGMTLAEIAGVVTRPLIGMDEEASELEKICEAARAAVEKAVEAEQSDSEEASDYSDDAGEGLEEDDPMPPVECSDSPTCSDASSERTQFRMSLAPSNASRLGDDPFVFNMDEEVGSRSPPVAGSPRLGPARTLLAVKAMPMTPVAVTSMGATFASPISTASLGASLESMTLQDSGSMAATRSGSSLAPADSLPTADSTAFMGPATYFPSGFHQHGPATALAKPRRRGTTGRRRRGHRGAPVSRLRKSNGQYPPLVEARCTGPGAIFAGLTDGGWEHFMLIVRHQIDAYIASGSWKQGAGTAAPPPASCPRF
ncbi:hypothetical protein N2152v2_004180 [Parachlorella kessleri]